jgi:hypothetical protein
LGCAPNWTGRQSGTAERADRLTGQSVL